MIELDNVLNSDLIIPENRAIVHLTGCPCCSSTCIMSALESDLDCHIEVCKSWSSMIVRLSVMSLNGSKQPLLVVDSDILQSRTLTVLEISNMMSVIYKCMVLPEKLHLAVAITQPCTMEFIKELQKSDIKGIIPCANHFGYDRILDSVKAILDGHISWPKDVIAYATNTPVSDKKIIDQTLTDRQLEVFNLITKRGLSNKKIASVLNITESTVKLHVGAILKKYGVANRTQLAVFSGDV